MQCKYMGSSQLLPRPDAMWSALHDKLGTRLPETVGRSWSGSKCHPEAGTVKFLCLPHFTQIHGILLSVSRSPRRPSLGPTASHWILFPDAHVNVCLG